MRLGGVRKKTMTRKEARRTSIRWGNTTRATIINTNTIIINPNGIILKANPNPPKPTRSRTSTQKSNKTSSRKTPPGTPLSTTPAASRLSPNRSILNHRKPNTTSAVPCSSHSPTPKNHSADKLTITRTTFPNKAKLSEDPKNRLSTRRKYKDNKR